ncbi:MAG TPA: S8 family serine peptidase [Acetobacteraceae bacterium]|nr:S8 family serine peptidase [Acetobacteraceae bacterium]
MPVADTPADFVLSYVPDLAAAAPADTLPLLPALLGLAAPRFVLGAFDLSATVATGTGTATPTRQTDDHADQAVNGDLARTTYGVTGAGIKVGILSDSFDVLGGAASAVASGDLPAGVQVLEEGPAGSHDEGRAMAELVHRIAPAAQILFHTATASEADFAAGITQLAAAGCNVIVDDVAYLNEPFFQQGGAVQNAVQQAIAHGVSYFTAAGNQGTDYIQHDFAALHLALPHLPAGAAVQDFGSVAAPRPWLDVTIPAGGKGLFDLQWNQPFQHSADSLGLALYDANGTLVAQAGANQTGTAPDQVLSYLNTGTSTNFRLVLYMNGGSAPPGLFKIVAYGNGAISSAAAGSGSGSVIGHEMVPGANTVGAMAWSAAPRFGGSNTPETFSSVGTGTYLLDANGAALAQPVSTAKVDFLAPDGSMTGVLAPFYGTSAAAANAAGVAALVLQADPALTPAQVTQVLEQTATPANGPALAAGAGLLQADAAVQAAVALLHATG